MFPPLERYRSESFLKSMTTEKDERHQSASLPRTTGSDPTPERRRSTRLSVTVPINISGKDARGEAFREESWTLGINRQGAAITTTRFLSAGAELIIENPFSGLSARARISAILEPPSPGEPGRVGVELLERKNVWGIQYPPADWHEALPALPVNQSVAPEPPQVSPTKAEGAPGAKQATAQEAKQAGDQTPALGKSAVGDQAAVESLRDLGDQTPALGKSAVEQGAPLQSRDLPDESTAEFIENFRLELAKIAEQAREQAKFDFEEAIEKYGENKRAFEEIGRQAGSFVKEADGACIRLQALLAEEDEARHRSLEETASAGEKLREAYRKAIESRRGELVGELRQAIDSVANAELENAHSRFKEEISRAVQAAGAEIQTSAAGAASDSLAETERLFESLRKGAALEFSNDVTRATQQAQESFRAILNQTAMDIRQNAGAALKEEYVVKSKAELEGWLGQAVERTKGEIGPAVTAAVEGGVERLQASLQAVKETALEQLAEERLGRAKAELEGWLGQAVERTKGEIGPAVTAAVEGGVERLRAVAQEIVQNLLASLTSEYAERSNSALGAIRDEAIGGAAGQIRAEVQAALEDFRGELRKSAQEFQESSESLIQPRADQFARYVEDALVMAREEAATIQAGLLDATRNQLAAMMRSTLVSLTEEARETAAECRRQFQETLLGLEQRTLLEFKDLRDEGFEKQREAALSRLQKDAEDFGTAAVDQFQSRAALAVREVNDLMNKKVGEAAFVVKDWVEQAAGRLEAHLGKIESRSEICMQALENKSRDLSRLIQERLESESRQRVGDFRRRLLAAATALDREGEDASWKFEGGAPDVEQPVEPQSLESTKPS